MITRNFNRIDTKAGQTREIEYTESALGNGAKFYAIRTEMRINTGECEASPVMWHKYANTLREMADQIDIRHPQAAVDSAEASPHTVPVIDKKAKKKFRTYTREDLEQRLEESRMHGWATLSGLLEVALLAGNCPEDHKVQKLVVRVLAEFEDWYAEERAFHQV
ncbi:MAG: hypothetical protein JKY94_16890 [Rhodobacteraceae bacterium]|nr:hypothetical protein [Paracoccaceae bacterium]